MLGIGWPLVDFLGIHCRNLLCKYGCKLIALDRQSSVALCKLILSWRGLRLLSLMLGWLRFEYIVDFSVALACVDINRRIGAVSLVTTTISAAIISRYDLDSTFLSL